MLDPGARLEVLLQDHHYGRKIPLRYYCFKKPVTILIFAAACNTSADSPLYDSASSPITLLLQHAYDNARTDRHPPHTRSHTQAMLGLQYYPPYVQTPHLLLQQLQEQRYPCADE
jgi:hypothetical protein